MPCSEQLAIGPQRDVPRQDDALAVHSLKPVLQHWPIALCENVFSDLDNKIRSNREKESIERRVMEFAERYAIFDQWFALRVRVGNDVSSIQQFFMPEPTQCALLAICVDHTLPERSLVDTAANSRSDVAAPDFGA